MGAQHLLGPDTGFDTKALIPISSLVKDASERAGPSSKTSIGMDSLRVRHWRPQYCESSYDLRPNRYDTPDSRRALVVKIRPPTWTTRIRVTMAAFSRTVWVKEWSWSCATRLRKSMANYLFLSRRQQEIPVTWLFYFPNNSGCLPFIQRGARHACRPSCS